MRSSTRRFIVLRVLCFRFLRTLLFLPAVLFGPVSAAAQDPGISDPYEAPEYPAVRIDTTDILPEEAAHQIFLYLEKEGYIGVAGP